MMSLQEFMRRQSVLRLYRSVLKIAQMAPDRARHDLYCEIRDEFDRHREEKDEQQVKFMIHQLFMLHLSSYDTENSRLERSFETLKVQKIL